MITQWYDLVGHKITGIRLASGGVVLLIDDNEFAVLIGSLGYEDDACFANLARTDNEDALDAAVLADAPGARRLRDKVVALRLQQVRETGLQRLEYLQRKYPDQEVPSE